MNDAERVQVGAACDLARESWSLLLGMSGYTNDDDSKLKVIQAMSWATYVLLERFLEVKTRESANTQR